MVQFLLLSAKTITVFVIASERKTILFLCILDLKDFSFQHNRCRFGNFRANIGDFILPEDVMD